MSPAISNLFVRCLALVLFIFAAGSATGLLSAAPTRFLFGQATPVAELNTPGVGESGLTLTPDGLEAFFARAQPDSVDPTEASQSEIYTARRTSVNDPFGAPTRVTELTPPATYLDAKPSISSDGLMLYYNQFHAGSDEERRGSSRIFVAARPSRDAPFGTPQEVAGLREPTSVDGMFRPEVSADGLSLYMQYLPIVSGERDSDVYVAHRASVNDPWGLAQPVPEFTSKALWQSAPALTSDGQGLFAELTWSHSQSELPDQLRGDSEVYFSQRTEQGGWSKPVNLGDAINKPGYTTDPYLTTDGSTLYFNRTVNYETGSGELYQAPVLPFTAVSLTSQGASYQQNFDSLGSTSKSADQLFPDGWTFTANDVIFNNATTRTFPVAYREYAGAFNAGTSGEADRALATNVTEIETGELQFRAHVEGGPVQALRLAVDVEAWQVAKVPASEPGEAAFNVILEADTGKGFEKVADLGRATTGEKLVFPEIGSGLNGNDPANRGSFDTGPLNLSIPEGATLRVRFVPPSETDVVGWTFGLDNFSLHTAAPGDANVDGKVDLADFGTLKANFGKDGHFTDGDFSGNGTVDLSDFGLLKVNFGKTAAAAVPEPSSLTLAACGAIALLVLRQRSTAPCRLPVQRRGNRRRS